MKVLNLVTVHQTTKTSKPSEHALKHMLQETTPPFKKIIIGCDHGAFHMKQRVVEHLSGGQSIYQGEFFDFGIHDESSVDYPDIARGVCEKILSGEYDGGILLCGSGIGINMAANKFQGIRCAQCKDYYDALYTRKHNDANVLSTGGRTVGIAVALQMIDTFLTTAFEGGRHARRVEKIADIFKDQCSSNSGSNERKDASSKL